MGARNLLQRGLATQHEPVGVRQTEETRVIPDFEEITMDQVRTLDSPSSSNMEMGTYPAVFSSSLAAENLGDVKRTHPCYTPIDDLRAITVCRNGAVGVFRSNVSGTPSNICSISRVTYAARTDWKNPRRLGIQYNHQARRRS